METPAMVATAVGAFEAGMVGEHTQRTRLDGRESALFEPDALLPAQWKVIFEKVDLSPEQSLQLALLEDALDTLAKHGNDPSARSRHLVQEVLFWVQGAPALCSFRAAVEYLGDIDPDVLARGIVARYQSWRGKRRISTMRLAGIQRTRVEVPQEACA